MARNILPASDDKLLEANYLIVKGDTDNPGLLPAGLAALITTDANEFRDSILAEKAAQGDAKTAFIVKANLKKPLHANLVKGSDFLKSTGLRTKGERAPWALGEELPTVDADLISIAEVAIATDAGLPPGDPHKFPAALRTAIQNSHNAFQTALIDAGAKKGVAENLVAVKNALRTKNEFNYKTARDSLYSSLPDGKFDAQLELFGLDRWDHPVRHRKPPGPPTPP